MRSMWILLLVLVGLLLWTIPGRAQDCIGVQKSLLGLDTYTKAESVEAAAWLLKSEKHNGIELLVVWFAARGDSVWVSRFRDGCMVLMPDGKPGRMAPITPQIREAIGKGELLFTNVKGATPFDTY